jgi:Fe-S oxidoreductase
LQSLNFAVDLIEAGCCGMAGTFGYEAEHYELSQKIGESELFRKIRESAGTAVAATGAACRMQIAQGTGVKAEHPLVLAARALGLAD